MRLVVLVFNDLLYVNKQLFANFPSFMFKAQAKLRFKAEM